MASSEPSKAGSGYGRCPICKQPTELAFRPFCSARCRDVDLSRWLRGGYAIPGGQPESDEDGEDAAAARRTPAGAGDEGDENA
ncbi:MAG TPA: DNA gyrase inhibitor YacG [Hyphomicrobium sp.]|jgi:hypothetical protein